MAQCKCCSSDKLDFTTKEVNSILRDGVINVSLRYREGYWDPIDQLTLQEAVDKVPESYRSPLRIIQFLNKDGYQETWVWRGTDVTKEWNDVNYWSKYSDSNDVIDEAHIKDGSITTPKLADEGVTTEKIADKAVTLPKLGDDVKTEIDGAVRWDKEQALTDDQIVQAAKNMAFQDEQNNFFADIYSYKNAIKSTGGKPIYTLFGNGCYSNAFGEKCKYNTFGNGCYNNIFKDSCEYNTFGNGCYGNTFKNSCRRFSFGNGCYNNSFEYTCTNNFFGNECYGNTFGPYCHSNTLGNACTSNQFGSSFSHNTLGNGCYSNKTVYVIQHSSFGNNCIGNLIEAPIYYLQLDNGVSCIHIKSVLIGGKSLDNIHILSGVRGKSINNRLVIDLSDEKYHNQNRTLIISTKRTDGEPSTPEDLIMYYADEVVYGEVTSDKLAVGARNAYYIDVQNNSVPTEVWEKFKDAPNTDSIRPSVVRHDLLARYLSKVDVFVNTAYDSCWRVISINTTKLLGDRGISVVVKAFSIDGFGRSTHLRLAILDKTVDGDATRHQVSTTITPFTVSTISIADGAITSEKIDDAVALTNEEIQSMWETA